jgi:hypothetical protein
MDAAFAQEEPGHVPMPAAKKPAKPASSPSGDGSMFEAFRNSKGFQEMIRSTVLDVLRSPEGQEILSQVLRKELNRQK